MNGARGHHAARGGPGFADPPPGGGSLRGNGSRRLRISSISRSSGCRAVFDLIHAARQSAVLPQDGGIGRLADRQRAARGGRGQGQRAAGVSPSDFRALLRKTRRRPAQRRAEVDLRVGPEAGGGGAGRKRPTEFEKPSVAVTESAQTGAGRRGSAPAGCSTRPGRRCCTRIAGGELLAKVLAAECSVNDPVSTNAFLATFPPGRGRVS